MGKHLITSKIFFLLLIGVAMTVSACNTISEEPNNPARASTSQELGKRPESNSTAATDSSNPRKSSSSSPSPTEQPKSTPRQGSTNTKTTTAQAQAQRKNYKPVSLSEFAQGKPLTGDDPKAITLSVFGNAESQEGGSQEVTVDYPQSDLAVVTITRMGVADDSIGGIRYRAELVATSKPTSPGKQWKLVWAGSQMKCQPGRGHQDWSTELCL
jgi:hypothetical protein